MQLYAVSQKILRGSIKKPTIAILFFFFKFGGAVLIVFLLISTTSESPVYDNSAHNRSLKNYKTTKNLLF